MSMPASNREFWCDKFAANLKRDKKNGRYLASLGWQVLVVWECETKNANLLQAKLLRYLTKAKEAKGLDGRI